MTPSQAIQHPFGVTAFGSSIVRIEPDAAAVKFAVSRLEKHPKEAFRAVREGAQAVRAYLQRAQLPEVSSSRVTLSQTWRYVNGVQTFMGYTARAAFHLLLYDLDQIEVVLTGIVDSGANELSDVELYTTRLKELRAEARRRAVEAAREKAINYCQAAQVGLGVVVHIEDVNPEVLDARYEGHVRRQMETDDTGVLQAFDPGSIVVGAAVLVSFQITELIS
jgi:uncharacterized protein YggE